MFTGIIKKIGIVKKVDKNKSTSVLVLQIPGEAPKTGDSVAIAGTCLTVIKSRKPEYTFELGPETLKKTNLSRLKEGDQVNIELPLRLTDRLGGHFVQGHIDGMAEVIDLKEKNGTAKMVLELPQKFYVQVVDHGSIAVDGVSLTVAAKNEATIEIMLMDYTLKNTTLKNLKSGDKVNIELDMLGKYVKSFL